MIPNALIAAAFAAGLAVAGAGGWAVNDWIENPIIRAAEHAKAAALIDAAAARATRDEQLRQFQIGERAANAAELEAREAEAWHQAQLEQLNQEIADYVAEARNYDLDQRAVDFVNGVQWRDHAPGGR